MADRARREQIQRKQEEERRKVEEERERLREGTNYAQELFHEKIYTEPNTSTPVHRRARVT